jgi:hypothetical protein
MKNEQTIHALQPVGGTRVATRRRLEDMGQDILVEATPIGGRLAWLLASLDGGASPQEEQVRGHPFYVIRHSRDLDQHVMELIDALIELRIAHPRLVQLELVLPVPSVAEGNTAEGTEPPGAEVTS